MPRKAQSLLLETMPKSPVQIKLNGITMNLEDELSPVVTRHEDYYFDDGNLVIRVSLDRLVCPSPRKDLIKISDRGHFIQSVSFNVH